MVAPLPPAAPRPADPDTGGSTDRSGGRGRLPYVLAAFVVLFLAAAIGVGFSRSSDAVPLATALAEEAGRIGAVPEPTTTTTTTAPSTTTTALEAIPIPDPLPTNPYEATPEVVLGTIAIPKLGVTENLQQGMTLTAINRGPGHWPGTAAPGHLGNMVVAGHRTTYSRPFADLDQLVAGDQVIFTTDEGTFTYEVRGVIIVPESHIGIAAQTDAHTATLFACHPKGSATHRIVAKLRLLGPDGAPVDAEGALPPVEQGSDPMTDTTLFVREAAPPTLPATDG
jgi:LPXTG-site transpeptidase (sortase) family protein